MTLTGKGIKTYEYYRKTDPEFRQEIDAIRTRIAAGGIRKPVPEFGEFCKTYLGQEVFLHQQ